MSRVQLREKFVYLLQAADQNFHFLVVKCLGDLANKLFVNIFMHTVDFLSPLRQSDMDASFILCVPAFTDIAFFL